MKIFERGNYLWEVHDDPENSFHQAIMKYRGKERWYCGAHLMTDLQESMAIMDEQFRALNPEKREKGNGGLLQPVRLQEWGYEGSDWIYRTHRLNGPARIEKGSSYEVHTYIIGQEEILKDFKENITDKQLLRYLRAVKNWEEDFFRKLNLSGGKESGRRTSRI